MEKYYHKNRINIVYAILACIILTSASISCIRKNNDNKNLCDNYKINNIKEDSFSITYDKSVLIETNLWYNNKIGMILIPMDKTHAIKLGFSPSGSLINKSYMKKNNSEYVEDGKSYKFDEDGNIIQMFTFKNGVLDGAYISYYKNGITETIGHYANGEKMDEWTSYSKDGRLQR